MRVQIGFTSDNSWLSRLIRWFTGGRVSHALLIVTDDAGECWAYEADWDGFKKIPFYTYPHHTIVAVVDLDYDFHACNDLAWLDRQVSVPYGYEELFGQVFVQLARRIGKRVSNPFQSARGMMCSEACIHFLHITMFPGADSLDAEDTSPAQLLAWLEQCPDATVRMVR